MDVRNPCRTSLPLGIPWQGEHNEAISQEKHGPGALGWQACRDRWGHSTGKCSRRVEWEISVPCPLQKHSPGSAAWPWQQGPAHFISPAETGMMSSAALKWEELGAGKRATALLLLGNNILNIPVFQSCTPGITGMSWIVIVVCLLCFCLWWLLWLIPLVLTSNLAECLGQSWILRWLWLFCGWRTAGELQAGWISLVQGKLWARLQGNSLYFGSGFLELMGEDPVGFGFPQTIRFFLLLNQWCAMKNEQDRNDTLAPSSALL